MFSSRSEYDRGTNTYSPEGRLFQVEYAIEAIKLGSTTVAIQTSTGVVLGVEKRTQSPLLDSDSIEKIMEIDSHVGCAMSGLTADARTMVEHARVTAQNHTFTYDEPIKVESVTQAVCDLALRFGEGADEEEASMSRPFGVALLIAGIDANGPQLYHADPSGTFMRYSAKAIGSGSEGAQNELQDSYNKSMTLEEAQTLTLKVLKQVMEEKLDFNNVQLAQVTKEKGFQILNEKELKEVIARTEAMMGLSNYVVTASSQLSLAPRDFGFRPRKCLIQPHCRSFLHLSSVSRLHSLLPSFLFDPAASMSTEQQDAAVAFLKSILATVPPNANPFPYFAAALQRQLIPPTPRSYVYQLYVLSGITGMLPLVVAACCYVRWRKEAFWLFRLQDRYIMPQFTCTWLLFFAFFVAIEQGFIWRTIQTAQGHLHDDVTLWRTLTWIPVWIAFWCSCWSLAVAHVFHVQSTTDRGVTTIFASSAFLNAGGVGVPLLMIISVVVLSVSSSNKYKDGLAIYDHLQAIIATGAANYNGTLDINAFMSTAIAPFISFSDTFNTFLSLYKGTNILWFIWCALLSLTFITVAAVHLKSLRGTMAQMHRNSDSAHTGSDDEIRIRKTYLALLLVLAAFAAIASVFCGVFLFLSVDVDAAAKRVGASQVASILPVYLFALLGLPLLLFLLYKSLELPSPHEPAENSSGSRRLQSEDTAVESIMLQQQQQQQKKMDDYAPVQPRLSENSMTPPVFYEARSSPDISVSDGHGHGMMMEEVGAPVAYPSRTLQSSPMSIETRTDESMTTNNGWWRKS